MKAINDNKAKFSFQRVTAYTLSCRNGYGSTIISSLGVVLGILVLLGYSYILIHNYWIMLFTIGLILLKTLIPYTKKFLEKCLRRDLRTSAGRRIYILG